MNAEGIRQGKIDRIHDGHPPGLIDLFSGCGGLSLGFFSSGFRILGGVENNVEAACSHALNFHPDDPCGSFSTALDITDLSPANFARELYPGVEPEMLADVIVGGPPCQAFARVGRAKLREVAEHPEAFKYDRRAKLPSQYLRFVRDLHPLALVMENVIDILNFGGKNIATEICDALAQMGYVCRYTILNAVFYGVPQMRERFFLIALAEELDQIPEFPLPTHWMELPEGYRTARRFAVRDCFHLSGEQMVLDPDSGESSAGHWIRAPVATSDLLPAVNAEEAIGDLPPIFDTITGTIRGGAKRFDTLIPYPDDGPLSRYASQMRGWPGFENHTGISDHVIRYLPRDYPIFRMMKPGDQYPEACQIAEKLFEERFRGLKASGQEPLEGTEEFARLRKTIIPPYDSTKFLDKWRKMEANKPARTLMAHLGKDGYSHIHYDSDQARTISVREAARLQSFPDGFRFCGAMNSAFRQIGNAVPPLLAMAIARNLRRSLTAC